MFQLRLSHAQLHSTMKVNCMPRHDLKSVARVFKVFLYLVCHRLKFHGGGVEGVGTK